MDLSAHEFLSLYAESRLLDNVAGVVDQILQTTVALSGSRRRVIRNGVIDAVLGRVLWQLNATDARMTTFRNWIRQGKRLSLSH